MKQLEKCLQLVIKQELKKDDLPKEIQDNIIHFGLGHSVIKVTEVNKSHIDSLIQNLEKDRYYFRMSFLEDLATPSNKARIYMTHEAKFFKPKISKDYLYFLGLNFVIIELTKVDYSENYKVDSFKCTIKKVTVDAVTGDVSEELLWEKQKYGRIENYLPSKLDMYTSPIYQCRKKLTK